MKMKNPTTGRRRLLSRTLDWATPALSLGLLILTAWLTGGKAIPAVSDGPAHCSCSQFAATGSDD